jgi:hypothetical protein
MRCGMRILFRSRGANSTMNSIKEKINTESCSGNDREIFKNEFIIMIKAKVYIFFKTNYTSGMIFVAIE